MGAARRRKARYPELYGTPLCPGSGIGKPSQKTRTSRKRPTIRALTRGILAAAEALFGIGGKISG